MFKIQGWPGYCRTQFSRPWIPDELLEVSSHSVPANNVRCQNFPDASVDHHVSVMKGGNYESCRANGLQPEEAGQDKIFPTVSQIVGLPERKGQMCQLLTRRMHSVSTIGRQAASLRLLSPSLVSRSLRSNKSPIAMSHCYEYAPPCCLLNQPGQRKRLSISSN